MLTAVLVEHRNILQYVYYLLPESAVNGQSVIVLHNLMSIKQREVEHISYLQFFRTSPYFKELRDSVYKALMVEVAHLFNLLVMAADTSI